MSYKVIGQDPVRGLPKRLQDNDTIIIGQVELTSLNPFIIPANANIVTNLNAEKVGGLTATELKEAVLMDKKILMVDNGASFTTTSGSSFIDVTSYFIDANKQEASFTYIENTQDEGYVVLNTTTNSYQEILITDTNKIVVRDSNDNGRLYGKLIRTYNEDSNVNCTWTNGSTTVTWQGTFSSEPLASYINNYIKSPDNTFYKIVNVTDNGDGTGTFVIDSPYTESGINNNANFVSWKVNTFNKNTGLMYTWPNNATVLLYFVKRSNLKDMPEDFIKNSDFYFIDWNEEGTGSGGGSSNVPEDTPFLVDSNKAPYNSTILTNAIDIFNLDYNITFQSDPTGTGITITIGNSNDNVVLSTVNASSIDTAVLSIGGIQLQTTVNTLNQLSDLDATITGSKINSLFDGSYIDGHQHVFAFNFTGGAAIGDVVYVDSTNTIQPASASPTTTDGFKVFGVLVGIDSVNNIGYVLNEGVGPVASGVSVNDGDEVYLSDSYNGKYLNTPPTQVGAHIVRIGHIRNNKLFIDIDYVTQL